jgi:hypothetical protein
MPRQAGRTKGGSARRAPRLRRGAGLGGDLVSEGGGPRGPVTLSSGDAPGPGGRPAGLGRRGRDRGGEVGEPLRAGLGASPSLATSLGFSLEPLCVEEYGSKS